MVDLRFHLLSLIAVFLALGTGMLLGSAVSGDDALAEKQAAVVADLRREYAALRSRERALAQRVMGLEEQAKAEDAFAAVILPAVVGGRLAGRAVAVVSTRPDRPEGYARQVAGTVTAAGAAEVRVFHAAIPESADRGELALAGEALAAETIAGWMRPPQAVVFLAHAGDRADRVEPLLRSAVGYWRQHGLRVVAGESLDTRPSLVPAFDRLGLPVADHADQPSGRVAVVLLLAGAEGHFGVKEGARAVIPPLAPAAGVAP